MNREAWLHALTEALRPEFQARGYTIPDQVALSCGWPSKGATASRNKRIGECWNGSACADGTVQIFISPVLEDARRVADVVVHELIHAVLPNAGHGAPFKRAMHALDLTGPATATVATPELLAWLEPILDRIGSYPHAAITAGTGAKKQSTRLLKVACACGYTIRVTQKWLDVGYPTCPCGETMGDV